jgi:hypothetical protein
MNSSQYGDRPGTTCWRFDRKIMQTLWFDEEKGFNILHINGYPDFSVIT